MAIMDWYRVNWENLSIRRNSERINSNASDSTSGMASSSPRAGKVSALLPRASIRKCTCRKVVGFEGAHKKTCPLSKKIENSRQLIKGKSLPDIPRASSGPTLRQFVESISKVGQLHALESWLSFLLFKVEKDPAIDKDDRDKLRTLVDELHRTMFEL